MAIDHSLLVRQSLVKALRADAGVTALVDATRIYGEESPSLPTWPFVRMGLPESNAYEQSCGRGSETSIFVHAFAQGPGMDAAAAIGAAVAAALGADDLTLDLGAVGLVSCEYLGTQVIRDTGEASAYHAIVRLAVTTVEI